APLQIRPSLQSALLAQLTQAAGAPSGVLASALPVTVSQPGLPGPAGQPHQLPVASIAGSLGSSALASSPTPLPAIGLGGRALGVPAPAQAAGQEKAEPKKKPPPAFLVPRLPVKLLLTPWT